jgi:hypothetical protein
MRDTSLSSLMIRFTRAMGRKVVPAARSTLLAVGVGESALGIVGCIESDSRMRVCWLEIRKHAKASQNNGTLEKFQTRAARGLRLRNPAMAFFPSCLSQNPLSLARCTPPTSCIKAIRSKLFVHHAGRPLRTAPLR